MPRRYNDQGRSLFNGKLPEEFNERDVERFLEGTERKLDMGKEKDSAPTIPETKLDVTVRPITPTEKTKNLIAFASVKLNDCFVVEGFKIAMGEKGPFVNMPSRHDERNGKYVDTAFPVTADFREKLNKAILEGYSRAIDNLKEKVGVAEKMSFQDKMKGAEEKAAAQEPKAPSPGKNEMSR